MRRGGRGGNGLLVVDREFRAAAGLPGALDAAEEAAEVFAGFETEFDGVGVGGEGVVFLDHLPEFDGAGALGGFVGDVVCREATCCAGDWTTDNRTTAPISETIAKRLTNFDILSLSARAYQPGLNTVVVVY